MKRILLVLIVALILASPVGAFEKPWEKDKEIKQERPEVKPSQKEDQGITGSVQEAQKYYEEGRKYYGKKQYAEAIAAYSKAIELKPDYAEAYQSRAFAYKFSKNMEKALKDYNKAIALRPDSAFAYGARGGYYLGAMEFDKAIQDFTRAISMQPEGQHYRFRGEAWEGKGDLCEAKRDYERAIQAKDKIADYKIESLKKKMRDKGSEDCQ